MFRFVTLAGSMGVLAILSGAVITSSEIASGQTQSAPNPDLHKAIAITTAALGLAAAVWVSYAKASLPLQGFAWSGFAAAAISGVVAWKAAPLSPLVVVLHAAFGHLFMGCIAATAVIATPAWKRVLEVVNTQEYAFLRPAALAGPAVVFIQILLGALYRHQITGVMPHMFGAMIVALLTMIVAAVILQHFSQSSPLKQAATVLISAVLLQVCLGIAVFVMLLLNVSDSPAFVWIASAHVTTGTLLLAASVLMALVAWRNLAAADSVR
jgi:heme A synthase